MAASARTDRSVRDRKVSLGRASDIHRQLYGYGYVVTDEIIEKGLAPPYDLGENSPERIRNEQRTSDFKRQSDDLDSQMAASGILPGKTEQSTFQASASTSHVAPQVPSYASTSHVAPQVSTYYAAPVMQQGTMLPNELMPAAESSTSQANHVAPQFATYYTQGSMLPNNELMPAAESSTSQANHVAPQFATYYTQGSMLPNNELMPAQFSISEANHVAHQVPIYDTAPMLQGSVSSNNELMPAQDSFTSQAGTFMTLAAPSESNQYKAPMMRNDSGVSLDDDLKPTQESFTFETNHATSQMPIQYTAPTMQGSVSPNAGLRSAFNPTLPTIEENEAEQSEFVDGTFNYPDPQFQEDMDLSLSPDGTIDPSFLMDAAYTEFFSHEMVDPSQLLEDVDSVFYPNDSVQ